MSVWWSPKRLLRKVAVLELRRKSYLITKNFRHEILLFLRWIWHTLATTATSAQTQEHVQLQEIVESIARKWRQTSFKCNCRNHTQAKAVSFDSPEHFSSKNSTAKMYTMNYAIASLQFNFPLSYLHKLPRWIKTSLLARSAYSSAETLCLRANDFRVIRIGYNLSWMLYNQGCYIAHISKVC